jgi:hypothetical protein
MTSLTCRIKGRAWRVLSPEESLARYSGRRKCPPGSPKRQAYGVIKRQAGQDVGRWAAPRWAGESPAARSAGSASARAASGASSTRLAVAP